MKKTFISFLITYLTIATMATAQSWQNVGNSFSTTAGIGGLAASGNVIIAGTKFQNTPLIISSDGGITWNTTSLTGTSGTATATEIYAIAVNTVAGVTTWYAGTYGTGMFTSTNSGANWAGPVVSIGQTNGMFVDGINVYSASNYGLFLTTNGGVNWTSIAAAQSLPGPLKSVVVAGGKIFVAAGVGSTSTGIYMSDDAGASFTNVSNPLGTLGNGQGYLSLFAFSDNVIMAGNDSGTLLSTNSGVNWNLSSAIATYNYAKINETTIAASGPFNHRMITSTNSGVSWNDIYSGLPAAYFGPLLVYKDKLYTGTVNTNTSVYSTSLKNDFDLSSYNLSFTGIASQLVSVIGDNLTGKYTLTSSNEAIVAVETITSAVFNFTSSTVAGTATVTIAGITSFFDATPKMQIVSVTVVKVDGTTAITPSFENAETLNVYPNPFINSFILEGKTDFVIYDCLGKKEEVEVNVLSDSKKQITLKHAGLFLLYTPSKTFRLVSN